MRKFSKYSFERNNSREFYDLKEAQPEISSNNKF